MAWQSSCNHRDEEIEQETRRRSSRRSFPPSPLHHTTTPPPPPPPSLHGPPPPPHVNTHIHLHLHPFTPPPLPSPTTTPTIDRPSLNKPLTFLLNNQRQGEEEDNTTNTNTYNMHPVLFVASRSSTTTTADSGNSIEEIYAGATTEAQQQYPLLPPGSSSQQQRKLPSSQYKGVVPQPNGRWGAQIYEKHQRVWLGTFNSEADAARAYDVAAQRFRGRDAATNLPALSPHSPELLFLLSLPKAELVDMLRKHTYLDELHHCLRHNGSSSSNNPASPSSTAAAALRDLLFEKAVTPSDVGKLNRLVIPKQHAERHFPAPHAAGGDGKGVLLSLEDGRGKVWRFRYSYWNSSQSYVLTKGWSRYVKEMGLRAGDVVTFHRAVGRDGQLYIDWRPGNGNGGASGGNDSYTSATPSNSTVSPSPGYHPVKLFGVNIGAGGG